MPKPTFDTGANAHVGNRADRWRSACVAQHLALERVTDLSEKLKLHVEATKDLRSQRQAAIEDAAAARALAVSLSAPAIDNHIPASTTKGAGLKFPGQDYSGFPDEPITDGAIIRMSLRMKLPGGGSRLYHYAVLRANRRWFTTGATCPGNGYTWAGLLGFATKHTIERFDVVGGA